MKSVARGAARMEFVPVDGRDRVGDRGIVVIIGWLGATQRALRAYASLYASLGFSSLIMVASPSALMVYRSQLRIVAEAACDAIEAAEAASSSSSSSSSSTTPTTTTTNLIIAPFSNGGYYVLKELRAELAARARLQTLRALICDSCPCYATVDTGRRAMYAGAGGGMRAWLVSGAWAVLAATVLPSFKRDWAWVTGDGDTGLVPTSSPHGEDTRGARVLPRLFLYADDDELCNAAKLEEVIALRRREADAAGIDGTSVVRAVKFDVPSGHVTHLRNHRREYIAAVCSFLDAYVVAPPPKLLPRL